TEDFSGFGGAQGQGPVGFDARAGGAVAYEEGEHVRPRLLAGGVQDEVLALVGLRTRSDEASGHAPRRRAPEEPEGCALERPRAALRVKARLDLVVRAAVPAAEAIDFDVEVDRRVGLEGTPGGGLDGEAAPADPSGADRSAGLFDVQSGQHVGDAEAGPGEVAHGDGL